MLKVGIIGTGVIFDLNILGYLRRNDVEITCLCNRTIEKAKQKVKTFNLNKNIPIYSDYKKMLDKEDMDIVEILLPHYLHADATIYAAQKGVKIVDKQNDFKIELANELADIAGRFGIEMFSCCGDYLLGEKVEKAHCIDSSIIERLFYPHGLSCRTKPTRNQCGCTESTDIGTYDTCPHGCIYCYANANKEKAFQAAGCHEKDSAFLGYSKAQSDRWLEEIKNAKTEEDFEQLKMF